LAHGAGKLQLEIVSVLCLIGLLTHNHTFWIVALLLALIDFPDFPGWFGRIARAVEGIAGLKPGKTTAAEAMPQTTSVPLASKDSQIGVRMRVCLYGQDRTHPGSS
jgi:hypothetical protein